jgi:alpha-L-rhamnosidase
MLAAVLRILPLATAAAAAGTLQLGELTLNHVPLLLAGGGVAFVPPGEDLRLSWNLGCSDELSDCRGERQATYRLSVTSEREGEAPLASSGGARDSASVLVVAGGQLQPDTRYTLLLEVQPALSAVLVHARAQFHTALSPPDWGRSAWIGGFTSLRSEFNLSAPVRTVSAASLYASGVGCFQLFMNGGLVSDSVLDPGFSTSYTHRVLYRAFDVTHSLRTDNAIGVRLGFCKYGYMDEYCTPSSSPAASDASCRALNLQLRITYTDGTTQTVASTATGGSWQGTTTHNPVTYTHIYHGEKRDDRLLQPGWDTAGFRVALGGASSYSAIWKPATAWPHANNLGKLTLHTMPAIGAVNILQPVSRIELDPEQSAGGGKVERWLIDFRYNQAGFSRINVSTPVVVSEGDSAPSVITMQHAETANAAGVVNAYCAGAGGPQKCVVDDWSFDLANQTNQLTLQPGVQRHSFSPFSSYAGFRYVEVRWTNRPTGANFTLESMHVHTRVQKIGHVHFPSRPTLNLIQDAIVRTQLNNLHSLPSDCPTREKRGWMGDAQVTAAEANLNFDMRAFHSNFVRSIADHNTVASTGEASLECNPLPLTTGAISKPYNCCASVESTALPALAFGCSGWDFGDGSAGLLGSLPAVVPENSLAGGNQQNNRPGLPPDGLHFVAWPSDPVWEIAGGVIAHESYKYTGDATVLRAGYNSLKALVEFFHRKGNTQTNGLTTFGFMGDWLGVEGCYPQKARHWSLPGTGKPGCLLSNMSSATAQLLATAQLADMAAVLGKTGDHEHYGQLAGDLRKAYHSSFFNTTAGEYKGGVHHVPGANFTSSWQFANLMPLALNITPPALVGGVLAKLIGSIHNGAHGACASTPCIATGFWGTRWILQTLSRYGEHTLAMELATKTTEPSWGYMVTSNRTVGTLWEAWDGGSLDHVALGGGIGEWLYQNAGYDRDFWGRVTLRAPSVVAIGAAAVSRHVAGEGVTGWSWLYSATRGTFAANVTVPVGATAAVVVWLEPPPPRGSSTTHRLVVREAGKGNTIVWDELATVGDESNAALGRREGGAAVLSLASGRYALVASFEL